MYCTQPTTPKARKLYRCMSCGEPINIGDVYARWRCYDDGASTNIMHTECLEMRREEEDGYGYFEYSPFSYDRPVVEPALAVIALEKK